MKKLGLLLCGILLVGAGCFGGGVEAPFEGNTYTNEEFGFAFDYPLDTEVNVRPDDQRPRDYLGRELDFFASVRDIVRDEKPTNLAFLYSSDLLTTEEFIEMVEAQGEDFFLLRTEELEINGIDMVKVVNMTPLENEKEHYLFDTNGKTIILSVFIGEASAFEPILQTFRQ